MVDIHGGLLRSENAKSPWVSILVSLGCCGNFHILNGHAKGTRIGGTYHIYIYIYEAYVRAM